MPQKLLVLRNCGVIDPQDVDSYLARGGFEALRRVQSGMTPAQVMEEVKRSGLRGRGGGGFPTGLKWEQTAQSPGEKKYIICNASEGEVGAFKDRYILERDPFTLIEGMAIAAYAVGAVQAYIYLRSEYCSSCAVVDECDRSSQAEGVAWHRADILSKSNCGWAPAAMSAAKRRP